MTTKMRAKLCVDSVTVRRDREIVKFHALYTPTPEDNSYAKSTPEASAEFHILNEALHGKFKPGQKFFVDFTPAE